MPTGPTVPVVRKAGGLSERSDRLPPRFLTYLLLAGIWALHLHCAEPAQALVADTVGECPDGLDLDGADHRVVMQHIAGQLFVWNEYPIATSAASTRYCIVQEKPDRKALALPEARALIEASTSAADPPRGSATAAALHPDDSRLHLEVDPGDERARRLGDGGAAQVLGADDRRRVSDSSYPWNTIAFVSTTYPNGERFRGSAFLVGPHLALTNAHVLYDEEQGGWAESVELSPGQMQSRELAAVSRPFGTRAYTSLSKSARWNTDADDSAYDYAAIFFCEPFEGIDRYMPLVWNQTAEVINLAGYPADAQGEENSRAMWRSTGNVLSDDHGTLRYDADSSGGNSGGPVWTYNATTDQRRVIAIHAFGEEIDGIPVSNGGPRFVTENRRLIEDWLAETPGAGRLSGCAAAPPACVADCNDDGAVRIAELITAVNIAAGNQSIAQCRSADHSGDGQVGVAELVQAVAASLSGCAG